MEVSESEGSIAQDSASEFEYNEQSDVDIGSEGADHGDQMVIEPPEVRKLPYTVMNRSELKDRQLKCIVDAAELLDVAHEESFMLLRFHSWCLSRLQEAWFDNENKVREQSGLPPASSKGSAATSRSAFKDEGAGLCAICMQERPRLPSLGCGHGFCEDCWREYLHVQVDDGKSAVQARCPQHKCGRIVSADIFRALCDDARKSKYEEWYVRTYVDDNPSVKWCFNPNGCPNACEYAGVNLCEIKCSCDYTWCWGCGEEAHRPADCSTVNQWNVKNSAESENISWIRANTKKCPKCHKPIEKNQGCNHMVCSKAGGCGHEFCWLCLGEWSTHSTATGGYYQCNVYDRAAKEGKYAEEERGRLKDKHALDKYMFYFERFMDHDRGMKLTVREEQDIEGKVQALHDNHGFEIIELQFLYDALRQVRVCRRVLKWSYVFGYYLDEDGAEKNLFEHLQKGLEEHTDHLHEKLEMDFDNQFFNKEEQTALSSEEAKARFMQFRSHVTNYTNVTQKFREQILTDLGQGGRGQLTGVAPPSSMDYRPDATSISAPSKLLQGGRRGQAAGSAGRAA